MRTVTFKSVLHGTARLLGQNTDRLNAINAGQITEYINQHVRFAWHFDWWPEWTLVEQRYYRTAWDASTSYAAPTETSAVERFYHPAGKYYQSLVAANLGNVPATVNAGVATENSAFWAECKAEYDSTVWAASTAYAVGDQRVNPANGRAYQCISAHTSGATFDASYWGVLTPFNRYIDFEQTGETVISQVQDAFQRDPQVFPDNPGRLTQPQRSALGVQARDDWPAYVWLRFQSTPPEFSATAWTASTAYALGDLVYQAPETYRCTTAHTSSTTFDSTKFELVEFPWLLADFVKRSAQADFLEGVNLTQRSRVNESRARQLLMDLQDQEFTTQAQTTTARVQTYA